MTMSKDTQDALAEQRAAKATATADRDAKIVKLYRSGLTKALIRERLRISDDTVAKALNAAGVTVDHSRRTYAGEGNGATGKRAGARFTR